MKIKLSVLGTQLLMVLNIFIAFLLLFENKLVIPAWLQPVGRMHPLLLHFPIVILMMAMFLEFFRYRKDVAGNSFYRQSSHYLLLTGAILAGITVIMGLLLSREEGYAGGTLLWHKWTGVLIFFISSLIYFIRNTQWYSAPAAKAGAIVTVLVVIISGHYGASLTHGENFITDPLAVYYQRPPVPFDQALVFDDIIKPVLEKKCTGCHNADKLKGELMLTDSASIVKGGKSGKLFIPGDPDMSLLLQRVHLPLEDKKHMPPAGKAQLTDPEIALLTAWIKSGTTLFAAKVSELPEHDSLRMASAGFLQPAQAAEEKYDFSAADEKTIEALNTDYRTILPLAKESPALAVNIYNREAWTNKQLEELSPLKKQVVALNLNKLPVKDADLKLVSQFENLRHVYLNFTDISAGGLKELSALPHLQTLAVSGTKINYNDLKAQLPALKSLKSIAIWNTPITPGEAQDLQKANTGITFIEGFKDDGTNPLKLNLPEVKNSSMVFSQSTPLQLSHPIKGVDIRFTTDGSEPDSTTSFLFDGKTELTKNTYVKARAYKEGWYSSDVAEFYFLKCSIKPDSTRLLYKLNSVHQAEGAKSYFDNKLGVIGANNPAWANNWTGVRHTDMALVCYFNDPAPVSSVGLHYMLEEVTGIYPPGSLQVWGGENENQLRLLATLHPPKPPKGGKASLETVEVSFKPQKVSCLKIVAVPQTNDKGDRRLLLVDEMYLN
ncbi:MAG: chitobiase/beta-hexosaminidase C-terminal domain-containing protein [Chitinophagaceae bacterium]|nr:chitobiase/beta-hexosaminidase C-terminal domain-containing protein [Chitinophagaceae bacterium]